MEKVKSTQKQDELSTEDKAFNRFAEMMIEKIESIKDNWQKPWFTESAWRWPKNISGREYNGMNALMLMFLCEKNSYKIPRFCTFNQVQHMNDDGTGKDLPKVFVRRGETSFPVIFPSVTCIHKETKEKIRYEDHKQLSPEEQAQYNVYPKTQVFNVFNVAQTNLQEARPDLWQKLEAEYSAPNVKNSEDYTFAPMDKMIQENLWICPIIPKHQDNAYFSPSRNEIIVPEKTQFKTGESYYTTVFHEMTHSTGAAGVLDRLKPALRGSDEYAREELVAEMGAALVALRYGMSRHIKEDSCAYIKGWLSNLKESPQFIKTTLGDVRKATSLITQKIDGIALEIGEGKSNELSETPSEERQVKVAKSETYKQLALSFNEPVQEINYDALLNPQPLRDGVEFANVQRVFEESKAFQFSAPNRITSPRDVAYIFKQLETSSIENAFAVLVKDHKPTVLHLAMGTFSFVLAPIEPVIAADNRIHADEIYFVHNHPSGTLRASRNDMNLLKMMKSKFGDRMQPGIIINTRSGRYGMFTDNETLETSSLENGNEQVYTIPTYSFSRLVFSKTYNEAGIIRNSVDVGAFVSSHRLGDRKKLSYMVLAHSNEIQANVHTHYSKLTPPDYAQLAKRMADDIITYGGTAVITYGSCELKPTEVQRLQKHLKVALLSTGGHSVLVDHVNIKASLNVDLMNSGEMAEKTYSYISAADEGWLREPGERYAISSPAEHEEIQGIALSRQEIKELVQEHVEALLAEADTNVGIAALEIHGSRGRGNANPASDLDVVIEYHGDMKEDGMFNILNEKPLYIDGVRVDINPIRPEETGTLEQYMERLREYDERQTTPIMSDNILGRSATEDEATNLMNQMEKHAGPAPEIELTPETWTEQFGKDRAVVTPIGKVKMGEHQLEKLFLKKRDKEFGKVLPTLTNPDVIIEKESPKPRAERNTKYLFVKTFTKADGRTYIHFESVTVKQEGKEVSISSHQANSNVIKKEMQNGKILHLNQELSFSSEKYLTKTPNVEGSDLVPSPNNLKDKDTHILKEKQTTTEHLQSMREDLRFRSSKNIKKAPMENSTGASSNEAGLRTNHQDPVTPFDSSNETGLRTNHQDPVISFEDGANIRKNIEILVKRYQENNDNKTWNFIGQLSSALNLRNNGNHSNYGTFRAKNGVEFRLRISDHNAASKNFDDAGYKDGLSIVVSRKPNKGIDNNGNAHITEYYYNAYKLSKAEGRPLADIARSLQQAMYSGEYKDVTGLAERHEVNAEELADRLSSPIRIVKADEIRHTDPHLEKRLRDTKGWFDASTGEVFVVFDNIMSVNDFKQTVLHEVVGHKGLRAVVGPKAFGTLCESVYRSIPVTEQQTYLKRYGSRSVAGEEYMATLAEQDVLQNTPVWNKVTTAVKVALNSIGIQVDYNIGEMQELLRRSTRQLERTLENTIKKVPVRANGVKLDKGARRQLALSHSVVLDLPDKKTGKDKPVRLSWSEKQGLTGRPSIGGQKHKI